MERHYGPSNRQKLTKKEQLIKKLFGNNSENDDTKQTQELDDVLEITIDNDYFATPKKVHTPTQNTHTEKESLSPQVRSILRQTQHVTFLSPLKNTPTRNAHTVAINVSPTSKRTLSRSLVHTHTPKQTFSTKRFASAFSSRKRTSPSELPKRNTSAPATSVRKAEEKTQTHTQSVIRSTHANEATQTRTQPSTIAPSCEKPHKDDKQHSHSLTSTARTLTPNKPNKRIHPYKRTPLTRTLTPIHSHTQPLAQSQPTQNAHSLSSITRTIKHFNPSHSHSHSHAFQSATITRTSIHSKHTLSAIQPITHSERQEEAADKPSEAPSLKTIVLKNKYVPNGIKLSIAVEPNKKLSKNARKKITRKLISEF